jgi:phosphohistidine swiveling domain-containing protein
LSDAKSDQPGSPYVLRLDELAEVDLARAGTKSVNLARLLRAGFPVPGGLVLTAAACERMLASNGLDAGSASPEAVVSADIPADVEWALSDVAAAFGEIPLAVRSSAIDEDLKGASFAGLYDSVLDVEGLEALSSAVRRCWASAFSERVRDYLKKNGLTRTGASAVLIQLLVQADAAGVAFSVHPLAGRSGPTLIHAVRGPGTSLMSGEAPFDEWEVPEGGEAVCRSAPTSAIDAAQAEAIGGLAKRVHDFFDEPQDIEWASQQGRLFLLQARAVTASPASATWESPEPGGWVRNFRLGAWLSTPVTALFDTWLLKRFEERADLFRNHLLGQPFPAPFHVLVNGWYFSSVNYVPEGRAATFDMWARLIGRLLLRPRRTSMIFATNAAIELYRREWREESLPAYRQRIQAGEACVAEAGPQELIALIDEVARVAGDYFGSVAAASSFAWRAERALASFYRKHLAPALATGHEPLICGLYAQHAGQAGAHAVYSLDWSQPTLGELQPANDDDDSRVNSAADRLHAEREELAARARAVLAGQPKLAGHFESLLTKAQETAVFREEAFESLTLGWPLMRRAVLCLGAFLQARGVIEASADAFFLTHDEVISAVTAEEAEGLSRVVAERRAEWRAQGLLVPPLTIGKLPSAFIAVMKRSAGALTAAASDSSLRLGGQPASPGRATGRVRVIRTHEEFQHLQDGEILVAPAVAPAWTPLFLRAAAVVTDTGSIISHTSLIVREYGLPAIVGTGDATARLRDGQVVSVDGSAGEVRILSG